MKVGVLALQGAVEPHEEKLKKLGATPIQVRREKDLTGLQGIILPGGESSTMIHLLRLNELWEPLAQFVKEKPAWGVCAGAILLAEEVSHPAQVSFGQMPIAVARNAFGRQIDSFISPLDPTEHWKEKETVEGVFIRAPRILSMKPGVRALFSFKDEPVMVESGRTLVSTFHPELSQSDAIHRYFLKLCSSKNNN